jgi:hypothetical protein
LRRIAKKLRDRNRNHQPDLKALLHLRLIDIGAAGLLPVPARCNSLGSPAQI